MSPLAFLQKPIRWLRTITRYRRHDQWRPQFRLRSLHSEGDRRPVQRTGPEQLGRGVQRCRADPRGDAGSIHRTFCAGWVSARGAVPLLRDGRNNVDRHRGKKDELPSPAHFDGKALDEHRIIPVAADHPDARKLVGCGPCCRDRTCASSIRSTTAIARGPRRRDLGGQSQRWAGLLENPGATQETFQAKLADSTSGTYLRTGDLGFLHEGELFVTGRLKDLIIVRGVNRYPQDIEQTVEQSNNTCRPAPWAVFRSTSVDGNV
jgi:hypothetical protein